LGGEGHVFGGGQALFGPIEIPVDIQVSPVKEVVDVEGDEGVQEGELN
jgi:hypothetical protein